MKTDPTRTTTNQRRKLVWLLALILMLAACGSTGVTEVALPPAAEMPPQSPVEASMLAVPTPTAPPEAVAPIQPTASLQPIATEDEASPPEAIGESSETYETVRDRYACETTTRFVVIEESTDAYDFEDASSAETLALRLQEAATIAYEETPIESDVNEALGVLVDFLFVAAVRADEVGWNAVLTGGDAEFAAYAEEHADAADAADDVIRAFVHQDCGVSDETLDTHIEAELARVTASHASGGASGVDDRETVLVRSPDQMVQVAVPTTWTVHAGYPWTNDVSIFATEQPVHSSADLFATSSVTITVIQDGTTVAGALAPIDESVRCRLDMSWEYDDTLYQGWLDEYRGCDGSTARAWVVSAATASDPDTVVLVQIRSLDGDDWFVNEILDSFILAADIGETWTAGSDDGYESNIDPLYCPAVEQLLGGIDHLDNPADYDEPLAKAGDDIRAGLSFAIAFDTAGPWASIESIDWAFGQLDWLLAKYDWKLERLAFEPTIDELDEMGDLLGEVIAQAVQVQAWYDDACATATDGPEAPSTCTVTLRNSTIDGTWRDGNCNYGPRALDEFANRVLAGDWTRGEQPEDGFASYRTWVFHGDGRWNLHGYPELLANGRVEAVTLSNGPEGARLTVDVYDGDGAYFGSVAVTAAGLRDGAGTIAINGETFRSEP